MNPGTCRIVAAAPIHLPLLANIERKAAEAFPDALLPRKVKNSAVALGRLEAAQRNRSLMVTLDAGGGDRRLPSG